MIKKAQERNLLQLAEDLYGTNDNEFSSIDEAAKGLDNWYHMIQFVDKDNDWVTNPPDKLHYVGSDHHRICEREPTTNQGRSTCFDCNSPTNKVQGFTETYDVCPKCQK